METERRLEGDTLLRVRPKDSLFVGDKVRHDPPKPDLSAVVAGAPFRDKLHAETARRCTLPLSESSGDSSVNWGCEGRSKFPWEAARFVASIVSQTMRGVRLPNPKPDCDRLDRSWNLLSRSIDRRIISCLLAVSSSSNLSLLSSTRCRCSTSLLRIASSFWRRSCCCFSRKSCARRCASCSSSSFFFRSASCRSLAKRTFSSRSLSLAGSSGDSFLSFLAGGSSGVRPPAWERAPPEEEVTDAVVGVVGSVVAVVEEVVQVVVTGGMLVPPSGGGVVAPPS